MKCKKCGCEIDGRKKISKLTGMCPGCAKRFAKTKLAKVAKTKLAKVVTKKNKIMKGKMTIVKKKKVQKGG
jgi:hypothetical protein